MGTSCPEEKSGVPVLEALLAHGFTLASDFAPISAPPTAVPRTRVRLQSIRKLAIWINYHKSKDYTKDVITRFGIKGRNPIYTPDAGPELSLNKPEEELP